jgi:hypothetical protein
MANQRKRKKTAGGNGRRIGCGCAKVSQRPRGSVEETDCDVQFILFSVVFGKAMRRFWPGEGEEEEVDRKWNKMEEHKFQF